jgi:4'-phosphopantetheinyl transferase
MRWLARGENDMSPDLQWLAAVERSRLSTFRFTKRRTEYLLRRWTAKHAVAATLALPTDSRSLASIEVLNRWTGAPHVQIKGEPLGLDVSLTDRAGWAVCVVDDRPGSGHGGGAMGGTVGIDLELVEPRSDAFITDFLTLPEQAYVAAQGRGDARHATANLLWSAKESALKVMQTGLRVDTRTVEVTIHEAPGTEGWTPLTVTAVDGRIFPGWWRRNGVFLLTIAFAEPAPPPSILPASADLTTAQPLHSWVTDPRVF